MRCIYKLCCFLGQASVVYQPRASIIERHPLNLLPVILNNVQLRHKAPARSPRSPPLTAPPPPSVLPSEFDRDLEFDVDLEFNLASTATPHSTAATLVNHKATPEAFPPTPAPRASQRSLYRNACPSRAAVVARLRGSRGGFPSFRPLD